MFNSLQEAFDVTVEKLAKQGRRAFDGNACFYKSNQNDLSCGIGVHFPSDDQFIQSANLASVYLTIDNLIRSNAKFYNDYLNISGVDSNVAIVFWNHIQRAHDSATNLEFFKKNFEKVANAFGLSNSASESVSQWIGG